MEKIELFSTFGIAFAISFGSACITWLYTFCIGDPHRGEISKGRIFSKFGYWLMYQYDRFELAEDKRIMAKITAMKNKALQPAEFKLAEMNIMRSRKLNIYKPLGACPICSGVWFALILHIIAFAAFSVSWWLYIPSVAQSAFMVKKWLI